MNKRLTLEETEKCLKAWRELADEEALNILTMCNCGLVTYFVKKNMGKGLNYEELQSAGNEGLINAINKFDYQERPIEGFSTYIATAINNGIKAELAKYRKHSHVLSFDQPIGQDKDGDDITIEDIVGTEEDQLIENVISNIKTDIVRNSLMCLSTRERIIILLKYGLDDAHKKTIEEIANILNCSNSTVVREEQRALIKMRHPRNIRKLKDFIE